MKTLLFRLTALLFTLTAFLFTVNCQEEGGEDGEWYASLAALGNYSDNGDGTVTDSGTGLTWPKCVVGQSWNAGFSNCQGTGSGTVFGAVSVQYCEADGLCTDGATLEANSGPAYNACANLNFNGITGWRLPTRYEYAQVVESFDSESMAWIFPDYPDDKPHWTGSQIENNADSAYAIRFNESSFGNVIERGKTSIGYVRCVK